MLLHFASHRALVAPRLASCPRAFAGCSASAMLSAAVRAANMGMGAGGAPAGSGQNPFGPVFTGPGQVAGGGGGPSSKARPLGERARAGGMFYEESDSPEFHANERARVRLLQEEERQWKARQAQLAKEAEARRIEEERSHPLRGGSKGGEATMTEGERAAADEYAERLRADEEHVQRRQAERDAANKKRSPGRPLPGSRQETIAKERVLSEFYEMNPDALVPGQWLWIFLTLLMCFMIWLTTRKGGFAGEPVYDDGEVRSLYK